MTTPAPVFSVTALQRKVRVFQVKHPFHSPSLLCSIYLDKEYTVYKYVDEDDSMFELLSIRFDPRVYHVFSVHEDCPGLDHIGIVHFLSGLFSKANIPILYVNTYASNLIFIAEEFYQEAVNLMTSSSLLVDTLVIDPNRK